MYIYIHIYMYMCVQSLVCLMCSNECLWLAVKAARGGRLEGASDDAPHMLSIQM